MLVIRFKMKEMRLDYAANKKFKQAILKLKFSLLVFSAIDSYKLTVGLNEKVSQSTESQTAFLLVQRR